MQTTDLYEFSEVFWKLCSLLVLVEEVVEGHVSPKRKRKSFGRHFDARSLGRMAQSAIDLGIVILRKAQKGFLVSR